MQKRLFALAVLVVNLSLWRADAALFSSSYTSGFVNGGIVPDANPNGWQDTRSVIAFDPQLPSQITDLNVTLQLSGGFNGDLYAYLAHDGQQVVLLNRVGSTASNPLGYLTSGMNVTFDSSGSVDIHVYGGAANASGVFQPDARNVDPSTSIDTSPRSSGLLAFNGINPNGDWTLYFADLSGGGETRILGWGLEMSVVPEPVLSALLIFAGIGGIFVLIGCLRNGIPFKPNSRVIARGES